MDWDNPGLCLVCGRTFKGSRGPASYHAKKEHCRVGINPANPLQSDLFTDLPHVIVSLRVIAPALRRIPKAACRHSFKLLGDLLQSLEGGGSAWRKLFMLAYQALKLPKEVCNSRSLATSVKKNTVSFESELLNLGNVARAPSRKPPEIKKLINAKIQDGDHRGAIHVLTSNDVIAPDNLEILGSLKKKRPLASAAPFPGIPVEAPRIATVSAGELREALRTFSSGASGGLDGLKPQHF